MEDRVVQGCRVGGDIKYILIGAESCVQMAEVPSTALDMGNEEPHPGN